VLARNGERPATAGTVNGARSFAGIGTARSFKPKTNKLQPIRAKLTGSDICTALGLTERAAAPVLAMCRRLIEAGIDPRRPLHCYRDGVLALKVRSLREGAALELNGDGTGFRHRRKPDAAPPERKSGLLRYQPTA